MNTITVKPNISLYERFLEGIFDHPFNKGMTSESIFFGSFFVNFRIIDINTFGKWEYRLIPVPDDGINLYDARKLCESDNWEAAKNEHLLSFSAEFPSEQEKISIIQLGSSVNFIDEFGGPAYFTYIGKKDDRRFYTYISYEVGCNTGFIHKKSDLFVPPLQLLSVRKIL